MGKPINFGAHVNSVLDLKYGCWASSVSLWSDCKTEKRLDLGGWCIVSAAPLQEAAERPKSAMVRNPALSRRAASGGCQAELSATEKEKLRKY
ncbi:hypothetical protein CYANOKiyG1_35610 [Okeania sp. KiyG1]|nr:hypothetical protein CYANOKiyG1_35610 [Okeania sp. KiyG1]